LKKLLMISMLLFVAAGSYMMHSVSQKNTKAKEVQVHKPAKKILSAKTVEKKEDSSAEISQKDKKLLAHLVHAEAKGEPYEGKVAVARVVLNRVEHKEFPDTVKEVIYEKNAFSPVQNGSIHKPYDKESYKAVQDAVEDKEEASDNSKEEELLYFYNPDTATSNWITTREVIRTIGNHAFAI